jgi:hypothetical protein
LQLAARAEAKSRSPTTLGVVKKDLDEAASCKLDVKVTDGEKRNPVDRSGSMGR